MRKLVAVCFAFVLALMLNVNVFARQSSDGMEGSLAFAFLQPRVSVAESSILADEVANTIFNNSGNYTFFQKQGSNSGDVEDRTGVTMYIKGFGGMEKIDMKDYTKFDTTYYGAILGFDWDRQYSDIFDATYGIFVSYVGDELKEVDFEDDKITSNNGFAGLRGNWYIGKLFLGAVLDYGFMMNKAESELFSKDYNVQSIGFSAKAGYNFKVFKNGFTVQPNVVFNSNYMITEEYSIVVDGDELKVKADDILNTAVAPGLKFAANLGRCWILTAEGKYAFVSSDGDIKAEIVGLGEGNLPETYYRDYASCGLGIEKIWGYTVLHLKGNKTFCGRDGYSVNAGIEFKF